MEKFFIAVGATISVLLLIFGISILSGTILWLIYPHIHALFPTAVEKGIIARDLEWWDSVCITWITYIFLGNSSSKDSKKD